MSKPHGGEELSWFAGLRERAQAVFPERQVHFRTDGRITYFRLTTLSQAVAAVALVAALGWTGFSSYSYVEHERVVAVKDGQIASARLAYHSLLGEVAEYQTKFNAITRDLERNHAMMLGLVERNARLQTSLRSVSDELRTTQVDRSKIVSAREGLRRKLANLEQELGGLTTRNFTLRDNLDSVENNLQMALQERNEARFESTRMKSYVQQLEGRLASLQQSHENSVQRLTEQTLSQIGDLEKLVSLAGISPEKLAAFDDDSENSTSGQGGPFIPAEALDSMPAGELKKSLDQLDNHLVRLNNLKSVVRHLPLAAPLDTYYITSGFGKRRDPLNKRWAAHYGIDFGASKNAPIFATAPGVVKHAGWKGRYGRFIEIDHGNGVITRFGHLAKIFVKRGQKVAFRDKIPLLGNSGRTTGAHLHYETLFKNRNINPMKFIKAGRHVFQEQ
jgi:murein DD-endopeptidase MepM/ murein hydrolase activator NlpD